MRRVKDAANPTRETFSLYPTTINSIRELAGHFGSIGRAIQIAVEILYRDARENPPRLHGREAFASVEEKQQELKVPFSFFMLPRTKRLVEWLADQKQYGDRNIVVGVCENLLANLYSDYYQFRMTASEREAENRTVRRQRKRRPRR
jgi:hypothetical protein